MNIPSWLRASALILVNIAGVLGIVGTGTNTTTTNVSPNVITMSYIFTKVINPENCNDWTTSWQFPQDWWNSIVPTHPPRVAGDGEVGFEIQFANNSDSSCSQARLDLYRAGASYSLSGLSGPITKATLSLSSVVLPSGITSVGLCVPMTGGGGALQIVRAPVTLPAAPSGFAYLGSGPAPPPFPAGATIVNFPIPWVPGTLTNSAVGGASTLTTTAASGSGGATFTVDVTPWVSGAIAQGRPTIEFMISGSDESPFTVPPPAALDCKTTYAISALSVTH